MKRLVFLLGFGTASLVGCRLQAQDAMDHIACLGNGSMAVYEQGANILQVFGPPYSAPSILQAGLDSGIRVTSSRETGTAIWTHSFSDGQRLLGKMTDFMIEGVPGFIREAEVSVPIRFLIKKAEKNSWTENPQSYPDRPVSAAVLSKTPAGTFFYNTYPIPVEAYHQLLISGNGSLSELPDGSWQLTFLPGKSVFYMIGGPSYPMCIRQARAVLDESSSIWLNRTRQAWQAFSARRIDFDKKLPLDVPRRDQLLQTIDDVSVLLKTQQGIEGGVLAGYRYHMGYVRDQYGVSRGLLKLGYFPEAKGILQFYWDIWKRHGVLHNAQGIGVDGFHIHENDEVEMTGYLIIQAFDYLEQTNDAAFIKEIAPMLYWAWESQKKNLVKGMLPFNGDETYVAGGVLPRTALLDGSAEATMLFITSGEHLLNWVRVQHQWTENQIKKDLSLLQEVKHRYAGNFIQDGKLSANNPGRMEGVPYPEFRHGVCESMVAPCEIFGWTQKTANNRYLCPLCFGHKELPKVIPQRYLIQSVSLVPLYIHSNVLPEQQVKALVNDIAVSYRQTGRLPSRPDGTITVGYDYGLLLYSLTALRHPLRDTIYKAMLDVRDQTGSWTEYYEQGMPRGTRYRPWESAINLEAAIDYAEVR